MKKLAKVSVVGAGNVGSTCAFLLSINSAADVYLYDKAQNLAEAKALDIGQSAALFNSGSKVVAARSMAELEGSHVVVMTAGLPRKPGMSRADLIKANSAIAKEISMGIAENAPEAIVIVVSNPLDIITWLVFKETGFDRRRVFGMAGLVDNSRLRYFAAEKTGHDVQAVRSHVLGLHSDTMVIPEEHLHIDGKPVIQEIDKNSVAAIKESTLSAGAQIVNLLGGGSAYYLPGAGAYFMARAVLEDTSEIFDSSVYLEGEYGLTGVCLGVPAKLGKEGIKSIEEIKLSTESLQEMKENARLFNEQLEIATSLRSSQWRHKL